MLNLRNISWYGNSSADVGGGGAWQKNTVSLKFLRGFLMFLI